MRRILVTLMLISAISAALFAADAAYDVLVYPQNTEVESFILNFFPEKEFDEDVWQMMSNRKRDDDLRSLGQELVSAYSSENEQKISTAAERYQTGPAVETSSGNAFPVTLVNSKGLSYDVEAMVKDVVLLKYVCDTTGADLIIMPVSGYLQGFRLLSIYVYEYGSQSVRIVYQTISTDSDRFQVNAALSVAGYFFNGAPALVELADLAAGAVVEVDGNEVNCLDGCIMTTEGRHIIHLSAQGKQDRTFATELAGNTVSSVNATMKDARYSGLEVNSDPQAEVLLNGVSIGLTPVTLENYVIPSSLRFSAEGYAQKTVGILSETQDISISLKPQWMSDENLHKEAKDGFYTRFAVCLVVFGARLAMNALSDGTGNFINAMNAVSTAALTVSFVDLIGSLVDYYRQTEYIAP